MTAHHHRRALQWSPWCAPGSTCDAKPLIRALEDGELALAAEACPHRKRTPYYSQNPYLEAALPAQHQNEGLFTTSACRSAGGTVPASLRQDDRPPQRAEHSDLSEVRHFLLQRFACKCMHVSRWAAYTAGCDAQLEMPILRFAVA